MKLNIQFFAAERGKNVKALMETRAKKVEKLELLYATLEGEARAITEEEEEQVRAIQEEIDNIDKTVKVLEDIQKRLVNREEGEERSEEGEERALAEEKAFEAYLRGVVLEERAEVNLAKGENGDIVPATIANKIIKKIYDICPVLEKATKYKVKGKLSIPYYDDEDGDITMTYATEFEELQSKTGKFKTIDLTGFLAGVLTKISKSLINNSQFNLVSFVVDQMAYNAARFIEKELLVGTEGKITGLSTVKLAKTAGAADKVTADELIEMQAMVKDAFQKDAFWIMSSDTRTAVKKLKDGNNRYLLQDDISAPFGKTLLGKPVYVSDNMPNMSAGAKAIYYGDMSGLAVKITEDLEIQILREKFATQHAVGVVGWMELDAKVENAQKIAVMKMA